MTEIEYLDFEKPIEDLMLNLQQAEQLGREGIEVKQTISDLKKKLESKKNEIYSNLSAWQRVQLSRHPQRPYTLEYIEEIADDFIELHGDRTVKDDKAMIGGWAKIDSKVFMLIGQQKGKNTKMRQYRNFGMANPEGYRKALRLMKMAEKFGEKNEVCNAIGAHHDEIEMTSLISPLVQVCDGVSGARPGARRAIVDEYIKRIKELEETAMGYPGVSNSYAIQAGRELRVVVESEKVNDDMASKLSFQISDKIQNEMTYPGQVKVTVIRETRAVSYAK